MNTQPASNIHSARNLAESSAIHLFHAENWLLTKAKARINASGITFKQFNILSILFDAEKNLSLQEIQSRLPEKKADVSRLVERMIGKSLLEKVHSVTDRRKVEINLTEAGKRKYREVKERGMGFEQLQKKLSFEELELLDSLLKKIC